MRRSHMAFEETRSGCRRDSYGYGFMLRSLSQWDMTMCGQYPYERLKWRFEKWNMSWLTAAPVGS